MFSDARLPAAWTSMSCSGFWTGNLRSSRGSRTENTAVFAPIASARVATAVAVNPGFFLSIRKPNFTSCHNAPIVHLGVAAPLNRNFHSLVPRQKAFYACALRWDDLDWFLRFLFQ